MASKILKRLLRGGMAGLHGDIRGKVAAAQEEEERRLQRNRQLVDWLTTESRMGVNKARQAFLEQQAEPKPPDQGKWKPLGKTGYLYNELTGETMMAVDKTGNLIMEPETKPKTGIPDFESLVSGRKKATGESREDWMKNLETFLPEFDFRSVTPEHRRSELLSKIPKDVTDIEGETVSGTDLLLGDIIKALFRVGEIPPTYERPSGAGATALADSIEAARTDPTVAAALMDFMPQEDPEITDAKNKLMTGQWDQAKFDRFMIYHEGQNAENR